jgi:hypothetical protein
VVVLPSSKPRAREATIHAWEMRVALPGYLPCLIYHGGADYDCYGGEGLGPYYTKPGVTYHVTGSDPYDLDRESDGFGCE